MTAETKWTGWLSIVGAAIGYVATHYLTGANGASHGLVGLVVGGVTPLLVALIRGDDLRTGRTKEPKDRADKT
jgi:hypothetical protein